MSKQHKIQCVDDLPPGLRAPVQAMLDRQKELHDKHLELAVKNTVSLVQECDYIAVLLMLIEELGHSTDRRKRNGQAPVLQRAICGIEKQLTYHGNVFGSEMLDGLRGKLQSYGVKLESNLITEGWDKGW